MQGHEIGVGLSANGAPDEVTAFQPASLTALQSLREGRRFWVRPHQNNPEQ
jgi:hypothetical protein